MRASLAAFLGVFCVSVTSALAAPNAQAPAPSPGVVLSFEHSLIVYLFGIIISLGTAVLIKMLSSLLRKMQGTAAE